MACPDNRHKLDLLRHTVKEPDLSPSSTHKKKKKKKKNTFKTTHYTIKKIYQSVRGRGTKMPQCPYLYSHSSKLHNLGPEIGFPNLSLLIQSRPFKLCITAHCPPRPSSNETDGNLLICPLRVKGSSGVLSIS